MKITTIGEVLIDMTEIGRDENGIPRFQANPGGAPANVAVAVSKLGGEAGFIGCVGEDAFGAFLRETLVRCGVDVHGLQIARDASTTLAVVTVDEKGERSFSFCRKPGADTRIDPEKAIEIASGADILHFGSVSLTDPVCRDTIVRVVEAAKRSGAIITYDPNYRPPLWGSEAEALEAIVAYLPMADVVKVSLEEAQMITGESDVAACAQAMRRFGNAILLITDGPNGAYYCKDGVLGHVPGMDVRAVDTTGAGDIFFGSFLYELIQSGKAPEEAGAEDLEAFCRLAVRQSGYSVLKKGAIPSIPEYHI